MFVHRQTGPLRSVCYFGLETEAGDRETIQIDQFQCLATVCLESPSGVVDLQTQDCANTIVRPLAEEYAGHLPIRIDRAAVAVSSSDDDICSLQSLYIAGTSFGGCDKSQSICTMYGALESKAILNPAM